MIPQMKRYEIQILLKAGHTQEDAARIADGVAEDRAASRR